MPKDDIRHTRLPLYQPPPPPLFTTASITMTVAKALAFLTLLACMVGFPAALESLFRNVGI